MNDFPGATDVLSLVQVIFDGTNLIRFPCIAEKLVVNFWKIMFVTNTSEKARQLGNINFFQFTNEVGCILS